MSTKQYDRMLSLILLISLILMALAINSCTTSKPKGKSTTDNRLELRQEYFNMDKTPEEIQQILEYYKNYDPNGPVQVQPWMLDQKIKNIEKDGN